jgi:hypothetical protein
VTAAKLITFVSAGFVNIRAADIGTLRVLLLTLLPNVAGLVLCRAPQ